jgi:hypothetical protein
MGTSVLVIDGKVVHADSLPHPKKVVTSLQET